MIRTKDLVGFIENEKACYEHKVNYSEIERAEYFRQIGASNRRSE